MGVPSIVHGASTTWPEAHLTPGAALFRVAGKFGEFGAFGKLALPSTFRAINRLRTDCPVAVMSERLTKSANFGSRAKKDLVLIAVGATVAFCLVSYFDLFDGLASLTQAKSRWPLEEILTALVVLAIALGVFSFRRWRELNEETRQRLLDLEKLAASEARYRNLVEMPSLGVMLMDLSGRYVYVSPKMEELTGYTPEEFYSDTRIGWRLTRGEDHRSGLSAFKHAVQGETTTNQGFRLIHKNGEIRWATGSSFPVFDADGKVRAVEVIIIDITTSKRLEERLRQSQKMEAIGQLGAGVAHNFNNLLQGIYGSLELAATGPPSEVQRYLADATDVSRRGAAIVKQLLVLTRHPADEGRVVFDLRNVIEDVCRVCHSTFDRKITIHLEASTVPTICGHPEQIEQVVLNLCINARDAMADSRYPSPSMTIAVDVQTLPDDAITCNLERTGEFIRARVTDQGIGMDEETQRRAFEPFFTTKDVDKGTGLGLSTAYGIVEQHGGWIDCESVLGEGSTFSIFLPVSAGTEAPPAQPVDPPPPRSSPKRNTETILLVEDEDAVRRTIALMLERAGYTVFEGTDGLEGLTIFDGERDGIDLVLLDLSMPKMSGEELLEELRSRDADIPIVLITGHEPDPSLAERVQAVIAKPVAFQELSERIRHALDRVDPSSPITHPSTTV